jgi:hypothetical protein
MNDMAKINSRAGERGAVSIKTLLGLVAAALLAFVLIKVAPAYIEERGLTIEVDELARISAVRNLKKEEIQKGIDKLNTDYELPAGSINIVSQGSDMAQISVKYVRSIDLIVTQYDWKVDYTANGRSL